MLNKFIDSVLNRLGLYDHLYVDQRHERVCLFIRAQYEREVQTWREHMPFKFATNDDVIYDHVNHTHPKLIKGKVGVITENTYSYKSFLDKAVKPALIEILKDVDKQNKMSDSDTMKYLYGSYIALKEVRRFWAFDYCNWDYEVLVGKNSYTVSDSDQLHFSSTEHGKNLVRKNTKLVDLYRKFNQVAEAIETMNESMDRIQGEIDLILNPEPVIIEVASEESGPSYLEPGFPLYDLYTRD